MEKGEYQKAKLVDIFWGPLLYAVCTFIPVFMAVYLGADVINAIVNAVPRICIRWYYFGG
ncbi:MAG: PTS sugar transporter subunit IIC [Coprobacillus cateniformis]